MYALSNYSNRKTISEFMKKLLKTEKNPQEKADSIHDEMANEMHYNSPIHVSY